MKAASPMLLLFILLTIPGKLPSCKKEPGDQPLTSGHGQVDTPMTRVKLQFAGSDTNVINFLHTTSQMVQGMKVAYVDASSFPASMIDSLMRTLPYQRQWQIMQLLDTLAKTTGLRGRLMDWVKKDGKPAPRQAGNFDLQVTAGNYLNGSINVCNTADLYGERTGLVFSNCSVIFTCKDLDHLGLAHFSCNRNKMDSIASIWHCKKVGVLFQ